MAYEIRTDIEIPEAIRGTRTSKYPFDQLPVATPDAAPAFVIPANEVPKKGIASVRAAIYSFRRTHKSPKQFGVRVDDVGNIVVFRTK